MDEELTTLLTQYHEMLRQGDETHFRLKGITTDTSRIMNSILDLLKDPDPYKARVGLMAATELRNSMEETVTIEAAKLLSGLTTVDDLKRRTERLRNDDPTS